MFLQNYNEKQLYLWTRHFERKCICNLNVLWCGNVSLTDCLGFDKLPFRDRMTTTTNCQARSLTLYTPVVTIRTSSVNVQKFYVLPRQLFIRSWTSEQRLFPYTALTGRFL